jgi:signal transduction histidine kinase
MRSFCQEFGKQQKVESDFRTDDLPGALSPAISLCFFRVLQEALHNSAKRSGVRHFQVRLWGTSGEIYLTVSDTGANRNLPAAILIAPVSRYLRRSWYGGMVDRD